MSYQKLKNNFKSYKRLLESDTLGSFDFFTYTVCLDSIDTKTYNDFQKALNLKDHGTLLKFIPLTAHELTHFIDSTSTLWGMKHLLKMSEAYCSNNTKGGQEAEFHKAKNFLEHTRSLRFPNYYTVVSKDVEPTRPWQSRITIGKLFDLDGKLSDRPILFSNFSNIHGTLLARSPISTVSILEASAMSNEMVSRVGLIEKLEGDAKYVERAIHKRDFFDYIYNQNITEYSVCVHILANHLECKDLFIAFQICSIITRIVLNFPDALLEKVIASAKIHEILRIPNGHEFEDRMYSGVKYGNLGILYYLICKSLPKYTQESKLKMIDGVEESLGRLGLSFSSINTEACKEAEEITSKLKESKLNAIRILASVGRDNFHKISMKSASLDFSNLSTPAIYLGDGEEVRIFNNNENLLNEVKIEHIFDELYEGQEWVERFSEACSA